MPFQVFLHKIIMLLFLTCTLLTVYQWFSASLLPSLSNLLLLVDKLKTYFDEDDDKASLEMESHVEKDTIPGTFFYN